MCGIDTVDVRTVPNNVSYFNLASDGTYSDSYTVKKGQVCYIDESQVNLLWDREVFEYIRRHFGGIVGVMHTRRFNVSPPVYRTRKFVVGG